MTANEIGLTVNVASLATGLIAGLVVFGLVFTLGASLFSARWFLIWFLATLTTFFGSIAVLHLAVNRNNPNTLTRVWVDPGALQKGFPLAAVFLGAVTGGWLTSRKPRKEPMPST